MKIKKQILKTILMVLIFKILLEFGYYSVINPYFSYTGFTLDINLIKLIESYIVTIILSLGVVSFEKYHKPSKIIIYILFISLYLPVSSLYWLRDEETKYFYFVVFFFLILIVMNKLLKHINIEVKIASNRMIIIMLAVITVIVYSFLIAKGGLSRINFNLLDVYETRNLHAANNNRVFSYLIPWQANIVNILLLVFGLFKKKNKIIIFALFLQVFLFSMTNFKGFLFSPILVIFLYYLTTYKKDTIFKSLLFMFSFSLSIGYLFYWINKDILMLSIFLRRFFYVPAQLHYTYFEYFSLNEKYYLSHSVLGWLFNNRGDLTPVKEVALNVYQQDFSPNVGIIGDAYLNFGILGILIFAMFLSVFFVLYDSFTKDIPLPIAISLLIIPGISLLNSALFTTFLSHGLIVVLVLMLFIRNIFIVKDGEYDI